MKFRISIECDNAAFEDDCNGEVAYILNIAINRLERGDFDLPGGMRTFNRTLYDHNGNDCGRATYEREE